MNQINLILTWNKSLVSKNRIQVLKIVSYCRQNKMLKFI